LGYRAGVNLVEYVWDAPINRIDANGLQAPATIYPTIPVGFSRDRIRCDLRTTGECDLTYSQAWCYLQGVCPGICCCDSNCRERIRQVLRQGCVGITSCLMGRQIRNNIETDFRFCFNSLDRAKEFRDHLNRTCYCANHRNMNGGPARAVIFAFRWHENEQYCPPIETPRSTCPNCGCIVWNDTVPLRDCSSFDFGYYDQELNCFFHASTCERDGGHILCSTPDAFRRRTRSTVYCVTCESRDLMDGRSVR